MFLICLFYFFFIEEHDFNIVFVFDHEPDQVFEPVLIQDSANNLDIDLAEELINALSKSSLNITLFIFVYREVSN